MYLNQSVNLKPTVLDSWWWFTQKIPSKTLLQISPLGCLGKRHNQNLTAGQEAITLPLWQRGRLLKSAPALGRPHWGQILKDRRSGHLAGRGRCGVNRRVSQEAAVTGGHFLSVKQVPSEPFCSEAVSACQRTWTHLHTPLMQVEGKELIP